MWGSRAAGYGPKALPELLEMGVRRAGLRAPALGGARPTDPRLQQTGHQACTSQQSLS